MDRAVIEVPWAPRQPVDPFDCRAFVVYSDNAPSFRVRWALETVDGAFVSIDERFDDVRRHDTLESARRHLFRTATPERPVGWTLVLGPMSYVNLLALTSKCYDRL